MLSKRSILFLSALVFLPVFLVAGSPDWYVSGPWEKQHFSPDSSTVRNAVAANKPATLQSVTLVYEEGTATFQTDGSVTFRDYFVYRIETEEGRRNWSESSVSYDPWNQDMPVLKVRLLQPDGSQVLVGNDNLIEVHNDSQSQTFDSGKKFRAPFPGVTVGTIVEEEIVQTHRPYLSGTGTTASWSFRRVDPAGLTRYSIAHPVSLKIQLKEAVQDGVLKSSSTKDGIESLTWESFDVAERPDLEDFVPPETRQRSTVVASSAPSWAVLAKTYSDAVDQVLKAGGVPFPKDLQLPKNDARAATLLASRWINAHVRYTALEFGVNSIVPYYPRLVLERGFGDCKDKATLLVGLLRAAGYQAWVSLLSSGTGWDIDPSISSINQFDHAIVFVGGTPGFWFDPTLDISKDVSLPVTDQRRYNLIASPSSRSVERTPFTPSSVNVVQERRVFTLAENGRGTMSVSVEYQGSFDQQVRNRALFEDTPAADASLRDDLADYYQTQTPPTVERVNPQNFGVFMGWKASLPGTAKVQTWDTGAQIGWGLRNARLYLPDPLTSQTPPTRKQDFLAPSGFTYRLDLEVQASDTYELRELPTAVNETTTWYNYQETWERLPSGVLMGHAVFEYLNPEVTAQQFPSYRAAIDSFFEAQLSHQLDFVHRGEALREEGRVSESIAEYLKLANLAPQNAQRARRLSQALESASMGAPALVWGSKAAALDPKTDTMWENLGDLLSRDVLGRRFAPGFQRDRAIEAYRKSIELAPENQAAWANLALLLEVDDQGQPTRVPKDLEAAREAYSHVTTQLSEFSLLEDAWILLIKGNDWAGARKLVPQFADTVTRNAAQIVTEIFAGSKLAPTRLLDTSLPTDKRQAALQKAGQTLFTLRRYPDAAKLLRQAAIGNKEVAALDNQAAVLDKIRLWDAAPQGNDAKSFVDRMFFSMLHDRMSGKDLMKVYAGWKDSDFTGASGGLETIQKTLSRTLGSMDPRVASDFALSLLQYDVQPGSAKTVHTELTVPTSGQTWRMYLVKQGETFALLDSWPAGVASGRKMSAWLDARDEESARDLFQWAFRSNSETTSPFSDVRMGNTPWIMRLAAQFLTADVEGLWKVVSDEALFVKSAQGVGIDASVAADLRKTLMHAVLYLSKQVPNWNLALTVSRELSKMTPALEYDRWAEVTALTRLGRFSEAGLRAEALVAGHVPSPDEVEAILDTYGQALNFPKLDEWINKVSSKLTSGHLNNVAWYELFRPVPRMDVALEKGLRSVALEQNPRRAHLHTLATVYATAGRFDEARTVLLRSIESSGDGQPSPEDWYVIGLIAEGLGFPDSAREAFLKVTQASGEFEGLIATSQLARKHLGALSGVH